MEEEEFDMYSMKQAPHSSFSIIFDSWVNREGVATRSTMETHNHLRPKLVLPEI